MDSDSITLIISLSVLLIMSAYFSATETAFSSLNRIRIKNLADNGNKKAILTLCLYEKYDELLSTILIGNNIVNISSASLATVLFVKHFGDFGVTLSTIVMTILVLVFSEITPKSLAKESPERFAMNSARVIRLVMILLTPINFLFSQWKKLLLKMMKKEEETGITEGEFLTIVDEATHDGGIDEQESELIRCVLEFNDLEAADILTPRVDIVAVSIDDSKKSINKEFSLSEYSRLPVYKDSVDNIVGFIHHRDFTSFVMRGEKTVEDILNPCVCVMPSMKIYKLLKMLQKEQTHIAVVTDEFGGTVGILTMEDILEELVGEIWDEHDEVIKEFEKLEDNKYKIVCGTNLEDMFEFFNITGESDSTTVSGWVIEQLDKIPCEGDSFGYENLTVTVSKTDSRRVLEITVTVDAEDDEETKEE
ncbi:MAG: hemolysin family protein [Oscillospiraceae bacterium]